MGKPGTGDAVSPSVRGGQPGELKHLSTRRKRNQLEIPQVAASERGAAQTAAMGSLRGCGVWREATESVAERAWNGGP